MTALQNQEPQRWLFVWQDGTLLSNEDISVEDGVKYDSTFCSETDLTIGLTPSAQISFTMLNKDFQWQDFGFGSFFAWLGVRTAYESNGSESTRHPTLTLTGNVLTVNGNGRLETYEMVPFGSFHADRPNIMRKVMIEVQAFDQMQLFEQQMPSATALNITYPGLTAKALLQAMCTYLGVTLGTTTFMNEGLTLDKAPDAFATCSMREVLGWIAEAACSNARFNRQGELVLSWLNPVNRSFDEHGYTQFEYTEYATTPVDKLSVRNEDSTSEVVITGETDSSPYMIQDNPFLKVGGS